MGFSRRARRECLGLPHRRASRGRRVQASLALAGPGESCLPPPPWDARHGCGLDDGRPGRVAAGQWGLPAGRPLRRRTGLKGYTGALCAAPPWQGRTWSSCAKSSWRLSPRTSACSRSWTKRAGSWPRRTAGLRNWRPSGRRIKRGTPPRSKGWRPSTPPRSPNATKESRAWRPTMPPWPATTRGWPRATRATAAPTPRFCPKFALGAAS